jgi:hypothetical protein
MDESANAFPMDITDSSSRPWNFRPEGYLVVILAGTEEAERAKASTHCEGVRPSRHQALRRQADPGQPRGVHEAPGCHEQAVGSVADDVEGRELYLGYAREDRCAL